VFGHVASAPASVFFENRSDFALHCEGCQVFVEGIAMKCMSFLCMIILASGAVAQEKYSFSFAGNTVDVKITKRAPEGFAKSITINSTTPITVSFTTKAA
jgi:hypothetical protein